MSKELKLYRPSNGDEGDSFMSYYCEHCVHDQAFREGKEAQGCEIIVMSMVYDTDDERYPREWCYDDQGIPTCTNFKQRPENDGDEDVPPPIPSDPLQLVLIADPTEDAAIFAHAKERNTSPQTHEMAQGLKSRVASAERTEIELCSGARS